jgi:hypothetical protein
MFAMVKKQMYYAIESPIAYEKWLATSPRARRKPRHLCHVAEVIAFAVDYSPKKLVSFVNNHSNSS